MYRPLLCISTLVSTWYVGTVGAGGFSSWFDNQHAEIMDVPMTLAVKGELPDFLNGGMLFRLGPTIRDTSGKNVSNYIDSFGRITKWQFGSTSVDFQSAIIRSNLWNHSADGGTFATHITQEKTVPSSAGLFDLSDMDNTDVTVDWFRDMDSLIAVTDYHIGNLIHVPTLRTIGNAAHKDDVKAVWSGSHSADYIDKTTGQQMLVNWIGTKSALGAELSIYKMSSDLVRQVVGTIGIGFVPYSIHSITVVGDYALLVVGPVELDFLKAGLNLCLSCSINDKLNKDPTQIFVFSLLSKDSKAKPVSTIKIDEPNNFFTFHTLNAGFSPASNGNSIDLDLCVYKTMAGVLGDHVLGNLRDIMNMTTRNSMPYFCDALRRVQIDIKGQKMTSFQDFPIQDETGNKYRVELASPNPLYAQKPYCFVYAPTFHMNGSPRYEDMGILKIDLCLGAKLNSGEIPATTSTVSSWYKADRWVGEPIFVPRPNGSGEDDGVLLVVTREDASSILVVLDARSMTLIAEIESPIPLMFEFHGRYFSAL